MPNANPAVNRNIKPYHKVLTSTDEKVTGVS